MNPPREKKGLYKISEYCIYSTSTSTASRRFSNAAAVTQWIDSNQLGSSLEPPTVLSYTGYVGNCVRLN